MKISDLNFVQGCACCQPHDVSTFISNGFEVSVLAVPQEDGGILYTILAGDAKYFKLTENQADFILAKY